MKDPKLALDGFLARCKEHSRFLDESLAALEADLPFTAETIRRYRISAGRMAILDQLAYRYMKLQDTLGQKVFPLVIEATREPVSPETPFMQKLASLERLGAIPSVDEWDELRETRNAIAHDYPEADDILAAEVNRLVQSAQRLQGILAVLSAWLARHFSTTN